MRDVLPHYYLPSEEELNELWNEGLIVLDANVLLNLYRYSRQTGDQIIALFQKAKERLWLPNQAALEFLENRPAEIDRERKKYDPLVIDFEKLLKTLDQTRGHPFTEPKIREQLQ